MKTLYVRRSDRIFKVNSIVGRAWTMNLALRKGGSPLSPLLDQKKKGLVCLSDAKRTVESLSWARIVDLATRPDFPVII